MDYLHNDEPYFYIEHHRPLKPDYDAMKAVDPGGVAFLEEKLGLSLTCFTHWGQLYIAAQDKEPVVRLRFEAHYCLTALVRIHEAMGSLTGRLPVMFGAGDFKRQLFASLSDLEAHVESTGEAVPLPALPDFLAGHWPDTKMNGSASITTHI